MKLVYMTAPTIEEARTLGKQLVERHVAACVNIIPGMESVYPWMGKVESSREIVMIAKTSAEKVDALIAAVNELHSYDVPCVISLPIGKANPSYIQWLKDCLTGFVD